MRKTFIAATLLFLPSDVFADCGSDYSVKPEGEFVVVAMRRASDVASPLLGEASDTLPGRVVSFDDPKIWLDGQPFDGTRYGTSDVAVVNVQDPNLSDIMILPPDIEGAKNCWLLNETQIVRDGKAIQTFLMVDRRVGIVPMENGALNVVLEKPLDPEEIARLQQLLAGMDYYQGELTGVMDDATRNATTVYAEYRGASFRFADPVISENLLSGLNVLHAD